MAQNDILRRYLDTGLALGQVTRARAEEIVKEMVRAGEVQREQTQQWVDDLLDRSRRNTEAVVELVSGEIRRQLESTPLASRSDIARLERRVNELAGQLGKATEGPRQAAGALRDRVQGAVGGSRRRGSGPPAPPVKAPPVKAPPVKAPPVKAPAATKAPPVKGPAATKAPPVKGPTAAKAPPVKAPAAAKAPAKTVPAKTVPAKTVPAKTVPATKPTVAKAPVAKAPAIKAAGGARKAASKAVPPPSPRRVAPVPPAAGPTV